MENILKVVEKSAVDGLEGCFEISGEKRRTYSRLFIDPGLVNKCFRQCDTNFIGISKVHNVNKFTCFCTDQPRKKVANKNCQYTGYKNGGNVMTVYS